MEKAKTIYKDLKRIVIKDDRPTLYFQKAKITAATNAPMEPMLLGMIEDPKLGGAGLISTVLGGGDGDSSTAGAGDGLNSSAGGGGGLVSSAGGGDGVISVDPDGGGEGTPV